ncbi:hypothetical protein ABTY93_24705, partial [Escherichia coli]
GWAILLRQKQKKLIMLPSETMIWQPEFTDKTLSRKPGAVHSVAKRETRLADDVRLLRQEERERRKNIEKLIQIERNAKARIRRATKSRTE